MRVAIYARYSSDRQRPASIEDQIRICRGYADRQGWQVLEDHVYTDAGLSGELATKRPGYQALLRAAGNRAFEVILAEDQSRLWRNQEETHRALRRLRFHDVKVFSVAMGSDLTDRSGRVLATVMGLKDETYLDDLREKTHRGLQGQVLRGYSAGGRAYGYRSEPVPDPSGRMDSYGRRVVVGYRRVIFEPEAAVVLRILGSFADGHSTKAIAALLNREQVPPPRPKQGRAQQAWCASAILSSRKRGLGILVNELYIGRLRWNRFTWIKDPDSETRKAFLRKHGEHLTREVPELRIVPQGLWDRVQARLAEVAHKTGDGARKSYLGMGSRYLLSGLVQCTCGGSFVVRGPGRYGCSFHANRGPSACPNSLTVRREVLESRVLEAVSRDLLSDRTLRYLADAVNRTLAQRAREASGLSQRARFRREVTQAMRELENIKAAIRQGVVTPTTLAMLQEAEHRVRDLSCQLEAAEAAGVRPGPLAVTPGLVRKYVEDLRGTLARDAQKARLMLRLLVERVNILPVALGAPEAHLEAEIVGNVMGLIQVMRPAVNSCGSGGRI